MRESEVAQSCPTLRDPMDCSLPGSSVHGSFQARELEWAAIAFSREAVYTVQKINEPQSQETSRGRAQPCVHSGAQIGRRKTRPPPLPRDSPGLFAPLVSLPTSFTFRKSVPLSLPCGDFLVVC